tara:strand:- start:40 stop:147 length:108 start_codon:yes stop_codon:yes gene_type:complete
MKSALSMESLQMLRSFWPFSKRRRTVIEIKIIKEI